MPGRITLIQGSPDPGRGRHGHALAQAYARGAEEAGHGPKAIEMAALDFPVPRALGRAAR